MWIAYSFITSPLGRYVIMGLAALFVMGLSYTKGRLDCTAISKNATLQQEITSLKSQIQTISELLESARLREAETQEYAADLNKRVSEYADKIKNTPVPRSCGLSRDDVERLRDITTGGPR